MNIEFTVKAPKETLATYLIDAEKFVSVHPLIYKMLPIGQNTFKVYEKVQMGFIPYSFTYQAIITSTTDEVKILAKVMGLTKIELVFKLFSIQEGTRIEEHIRVKSVLPIKKYLFKLFAEQHAILFKNIEKEVNVA